MKKNVLGRKNQLISSTVEIGKYYRGTKVKGAGSLKKEELSTTSNAVNRCKNIKTDLAHLYLTVGIYYSSCRRAVG